MYISNGVGKFVHIIHWGLDSKTVKLFKQLNNCVHNSFCDIQK